MSKVSEDEKDKKNRSSNVKKWVREMAKQLKAQTALPTILNSIPGGTWRLTMIFWCV